MSNPLTIILTPGPVPPGFKAANINELMAAICKYVSGAVDANVTFIPMLVNDPGTFDGQLIFNIPQRVFKGWDAGTARYVAVTEYQIGDIKNTFNAGDDLAHGWVILDGRAIAAISGVTGEQQQALNNLFNAGNPGGTLPNVRPANVVGLPPNGSFSNIPWPPSINPVVTPAAGVISGIAISNPPTQPEVEELRDDTEQLRDSSQQIFIVSQQIQAQAEFLLEALNQNTTPPIYAAVFCGYPAS